MGETAPDTGRSETWAKVRDVVAATFSIDASTIVPETTAADVDGWDSLSHTILMIRLEKKLKVTIPEAVAERSACVGDLVRECEKLLRDSGPGDDRG